MTGIMTSGVSRLILGEPINNDRQASSAIGLGTKIYAEGPSGAPAWGIRFTVTPLFPTGGKRPQPHESSYPK
jgi:hypothetical protein